MYETRFILMLFAPIFVGVTLICVLTASGQLAWAFSTGVAVLLWVGFIGILVTKTAEIEEKTER